MTIGEKLLRRNGGDAKNSRYGNKEQSPGAVTACSKSVTPLAQAIKDQYSVMPGSETALIAHVAVA
jgi:hypothetical protein